MTTPRKKPSGNKHDDEHFSCQCGEFALLICFSMALLLLYAFLMICLLVPKDPRLRRNLLQTAGVHFHEGSSEPEQRMTKNENKT